MGCFNVSLNEKRRLNKIKSDFNNLPNNKKNEINRNKSKFKFENIKGNHILLKIFDNLQKKKLLEILRYNKYIRQKLNITIDNYKEYIEIYSPIEIQIIPIENKFGKFINIKKEEEQYFHIYFNNNKEDMKRNFLKEDDKIININIIIDYQVKSFYKLFHDCKYIKTIIFKKFYRNNINNMSCMFYCCSSLKEIKFSKFITHIRNISSIKKAKI